jgi:type II secretory pathway component GspD/PulD (secretin)
MIFNLLLRSPIKLVKNRIKFLHLFIFLICFTSVNSLVYAQPYNRKFHIDYKNNLLSISAQDADLKNVLFKVADKTGIYVRFPNSLKKQITIRISGLSLKKTLSRLLKGMNHAVVYSGSRKNRATVSGVFVFKRLKKSRISSRARVRERQLSHRIRYYERRLESLKQKLLKVNRNSRQGKSYLRQIRSNENILENLKKRSND